mgnify:CR=1 FL=1
MEVGVLGTLYAGGGCTGVAVVDACGGRDMRLRLLVRKIALLARYDYMGDNSDGLPDADGVLVVSDPKRHRLTGGLTFSLGLPFTADIRLNYEAYFYDRGAQPALSEQDKVVVELMCRF